MCTHHAFLCFLARAHVGEHTCYSNRCGITSHCRFHLNLPSRSCYVQDASVGTQATAPLGRQRNKLVGSVLFFHLPSGFGNRTQVTMFVPQVPLPAEPSHQSIFSCTCWPSVDLLENICQMLNPLLSGLSLSYYSLRNLYLI